MTATCRESCCSVTPRVSVAELFDRGFRRNHAEPLSIAGAPCADAEGNSARFSLELADGKLAAIGFRATSCATLIAYCELIAEMVPGFSIEIAEGLSARDLIEALAGVPELKRPCAALAVAAFRAALTEARSRQ
jgi:NifU-like protein involved in Fe-S cluster formation